MQAVLLNQPRSRTRSGWPSASRAHLRLAQRIVPPPPELGTALPDQPTLSGLSWWGDSHAAQWVPTLSKVGSEDGFRLVVRSLDACPAAEVTVLAHGVVNSDCESFHRETRSLIGELQPDVVLTANSNSYLGQIPGAAGRVGSADEQSSLWKAGFSSLLVTAHQNGSYFASIEDTPRPGGDAVVCVTRPGGSESECSPSRDEALSEISALRNAERSVQKEMGISHVLSFEDQLCPAGTCLISDNGIPVFTDSSHLSQRWAASREPTIRAFTTEILKNVGKSPAPRGQTADHWQGQ